MLRRTVFGGLVLGSLILFPSAKSFAADAPEEFLQLVVKLIGDSDREFRAAGLDHVRSSAGGTEGTRLFAGLLPKLEPAGQSALIRALAERGDIAARPAIIMLLNSSADERCSHSAALPTSLLASSSVRFCRSKGPAHR